MKADNVGQTYGAPTVDRQGRDARGLHVAFDEGILLRRHGEERADLVAPVNRAPERRQVRTVKISVSADPCPEK